MKKLFEGTKKKIAGASLATVIGLSALGGGVAGATFMASLSDNMQLRLGNIAQRAGSAFDELVKYENQEKKLVSIINDKKAKIQTLVNDVARLQSELDASINETEAQALRDQIAKHEKTISDLNAQIATLQAKVQEGDEAKANLQLLEQEVTKTSQEIDSKYYNTIGASSSSGKQTKANAPITELEQDATTTTTP